MKKRWKVLLVSLSVLLVLVLAVGFVAGNFFYNLALNPHVDKTEVVEAEHNELDFSEDDWSRYDEDRNWFSESNYHRSEMHSYDGLRLTCYVLEQEDTAANWVVVLHGYGSASWLMFSWARQFYEMGYSVLLPDARGCGSSEGDYYGMGWHDRLDLLDWLDLLNEKYAPRNIVLFGISMGASTVLMATGEELPANVRAAVEDSGYTGAWEEFSYQLKALFGLPAFPLMNFASAVARVRAGYWLGQADALGQLAKSTTPTLFIHGSKDTFVPVAMVDTLYDAAPVEKERLVVDGAGHGSSATTAEEVYWGTIESFLARYLV